MMMSWTVANPSPVPLPNSLVVENGSKRCEGVSASMPQPSSLTVNSPYLPGTKPTCAAQKVSSKLTVPVSIQIPGLLFGYLLASHGSDQLGRSLACPVRYNRGSLPTCCRSREPRRRPGARPTPSFGAGLHKRCVRWKFLSASLIFTMTRE